MAEFITTQAAAPATLPAGSDVMVLKGTWDGSTAAVVGPSALVSVTGSASARTFTLVALPTTLGANGGLKVEDVGVATSLDTDDGSVAAAQANLPLVIPLEYTWNGSAWVRGGWTPYQLVSAASTNATSLKASAGVLGSVMVSNVNAAQRYLKFYNKASAPTVGTDTPVQTYIIPGNTAGAGTNIPLPRKGLAFSTGIAFALTVEATVAGTTGVAASEIIVSLGWL